MQKKERMKRKKKQMKERREKTQCKVSLETNDFTVVICWSTNK